MRGFGGNMSALASAIARRLGTRSRASSRRGFPINAIASAVVRRLRVKTRRRGIPINALASAIAARLSVRKTSRSRLDYLTSAVAQRLQQQPFSRPAAEHGDLPIHTEMAPGTSTESPQVETARGAHKPNEESKGPAKKKDAF